MSKQFATMSKTIADLKTKLAGLDTRKAELAAEQGAKLREVDRLEKRLVNETIRNDYARQETENQWREADAAAKRLGAVLAGIDGERSRLQHELEAKQRELGDLLTAEAGGWYSKALADYEKNLQAFVNSLNRLLAANSVLARNGGHPASIFGRCGSEWTRLFGPALYSLEGGKAHRLEFGADQKTLDSVRKELLG